MSLNANFDGSNSAITTDNFFDSALAFFVNAEKQRKDFKVGTEHEIFAVDAENRPLPFFGVNGIESILRRLAEQPSLKGNKFTQILEDGHVVALSSHDCSITIEPGGQLELSGGQFQSIHDTRDEIDWYRASLDKLSPVGTKLITMGFHPTAKRTDFSWVPKERYKIMRNYMPKRGSLGLDMMLRTSTVQANLDYESEADMVKSVQTAFAISPIVGALFASSPFKEGYATGRLSERMHTWTDTDPDRSGFPSMIFDPDFGYEKWINFALDVPMYFVRRDNQYFDVSGYSFRDFIENGFKDEPATLGDFADHLTTIFTEVRIKPYIETRSADCGPSEHLYALPALWKGILYNAHAREKAWELMAAPSTQELEKLMRDASRKGFRAKYRGATVHFLAEKLLAIAQTGLDAQLKNEAIYIKPLVDMVNRGETYAEQLLKRGLAHVTAAQ